MLDLHFRKKALKYAKENERLRDRLEELEERLEQESDKGGQLVRQGYAVRMPEDATGQRWNYGAKKLRTLDGGEGEVLGFKFDTLYEQAFVIYVDEDGEHEVLADRAIMDDPLDHYEQFCMAYRRGGKLDDEEYQQLIEQHRSQQCK